MKQIKLYSKQIGIFLIYEILSTLILSILNYFGLFSIKTTNIIASILLIIICFIIGLTCGKNAEKKGYLEGLKIGGILILLLMLLNIIFYQTAFTIARGCYYLIILGICSISATIGINKKNSKS